MKKSQILWALVIAATWFATVPGVKKLLAKESTSA